MNGPVLLFKQAVGSGHRAVFDIKSNSKGCARFVIGSNVRSYRIAIRRQSPGKALGAALNSLKGQAQTGLVLQRIVKADCRIPGRCFVVT